MAAKLPLSSFSSCIVCRSSFQPAILTSRTQVAYKWQKKNQNRKNSKTDFATVQLLQDMPRYGPKGAFLQVTRGQMRNAFYPKRQARYVVGDELKKLKLTGMKLERDHGFAVGIPEAKEEAELDAVKEEVGQVLVEAVAQTQEDQERVKQVFLHAIARLPQVIQPTYTFYRKVNVQASEGPSNRVFETGTPIFGSVSASDVAQEIRQSLAADDDTATIPIDESSVTFSSVTVGEASQSSTSSTQKRLKELGVFQVDVHIPGADPVRTSVEIRPDEARADGEVIDNLVIRKRVLQQKDQTVDGRRQERRGQRVAAMAAKGQEANTSLHDSS